VSRNTNSPAPPALTAAPSVRPNSARMTLDKIRKPKIANGTIFLRCAPTLCQVRSGGGSASPSINRII